MAPAILVFTVGAAEGIAQRLAQRLGVGPGLLRVDEAEHAAGAEVAILRRYTAVDVFDADPFGRLDPVENLDRHRLAVQAHQRAAHEFAHQAEHLGQPRLARHLELPAALEQVGIDARLFLRAQLAHRLQYAARLFQQALLAALVVAELLREIGRSTVHRQLFGLFAGIADLLAIQLGEVAHPVAQLDARTVGDRQDDLGIAQVEQGLLARALEHVLGQRQVAAPGRHGGAQLIALEPAEVAHRNTGQAGEALDYLRVGGDAAAEALPGGGIVRRRDGRPAALAEDSQTVQHAGDCIIPAARRALLRRPRPGRRRTAGHAGGRSSRSARSVRRGCRARRCAPGPSPGSDPPPRWCSGGGR